MRPLSDDMIDALGHGVIRPALLYEGEFRTGIVRLWTGLGPISWDGALFTGLGDLVSVSTIEETTDVKATGIQCSLSGVKTSQIALALSEMQRNAEGRLWFALMEEDMATIIPEPQILFRGRLDVCIIQDSVEGAIINITYENELIDLERPREVRYTPQEQRQISPGDTFLDFIPSLQDKVLHWGSTT